MTFHSLADSDILGAPSYFVEPIVVALKAEDIATAAKMGAENSPDRCEQEALKCEDEQRWFMAALWWRAAALGSAGKIRKLRCRDRENRACKLEAQKLESGWCG